MDSVAARVAKPGGVTRKTKRTKRMKVARKKSVEESETSAKKSLYSQAGNEATSGDIYKVLPKDEIRLLVLQPGFGDQPLECGLKYSKLCDPIDSKYEALSYAWGSDKLSKTIILSSHKFGVTQNLFDALLELRQRDTETVLWIDALGINQSDTTELNHQVQAMSKIYERAKEVIAWLGPVTEDEEPGLKLLVTAGTSVLEMASILLQGSVRKAIDLLMDRPYWRRAWTAQEIGFARFARIQCGKYSISFETLHKMLEMRRSVAGGTRTPGDPSFYVVSPPTLPRTLLMPGSASSKTSNRISPGVFLDSLLDRQCGNPRDSVYAFYNMFPKTLQKCIKPDYELEPEAVLLQAVSAIIKTTQSLSAITIRSRQKVPIGDTHIWQRHMPSWCPYVSTSFENDSLAAWQSPPYRIVRNAKISVDLSKGQLRAYGFTVGTISEVSCCGEMPVDGKKEKFSESDADSILHYFSVGTEYGLSIPEHNGMLEAPQCIMYVSSATDSKSQSTDRTHLSEAYRYYQKMRNRNCAKLILRIRAQFLRSALCLWLPAEETKYVG
jgi:hypothetical protein